MYDVPVDLLGLVVHSDLGTDSYLCRTVPKYHVCAYAAEAVDEPAVHRAAFGSPAVIRHTVSIHLHSCHLMQFF